MAVLAITRLKLKSYISLFQFLKLAGASQVQAVQATGFLSGKTVVSLDFRTFYTITLWEDAKQMHHFMATGDHLEAMKRGPSMCSEMASLATELSEGATRIGIPSFRECESLLREKGKFIRVHVPSPNQRQGFIQPVSFYMESKIK